MQRLTVPVTVLRIPPAPEHVRTARLVAGAAARRLGLAPDTLDEVRLATGEACARAVVRHQLGAPNSDVRMEFYDDDGNFTVHVHDQTPADDTNSDDDMALALISALVPESEVRTEGQGCIIHMRWPVPPPTIEHRESS